MKLKSLLLGSAAALALSTGAQAADPMTEFVSLGVCDAYGITGLTIESDDTCLKISGSVSYEFQWGDYDDNALWVPAAAGLRNVDVSDGENDWRSRLETLLTFEATTQTDVGAAVAHITLRQRDYVEHQDNAWVLDGDAHGLRVQDAYVQFGDTTVLMAGRKGSIAPDGNDEPFNFLGLPNSDAVDTGVDHSRGDALRTGGHVIQVVSEVADGMRVGAGLESLDSTPPDQSRGTFVAFVGASGAWGEADASVLVGDVLANAGGDNPWALRLTATGEFDAFKVRGAFVYDDTEYWNALISGEAAFDMFTIAASAEFIDTGTVGTGTVPAGVNQFGAGVSAGFQATETIAINAGYRYFDADTGDVFAVDSSSWQAALQVVAAVTETINATGEVGIYGGDVIEADPAVADTISYVELGVDYAPGGGFTTGGGVEFNTEGAYKLKFNAEKTF